MPLLSSASISAIACLAPCNLVFPASQSFISVNEFLSFFNNTNNTLALQTVKQHAAEIRYKLGSRIKDQVRVIPQLEFFVDDTSEYVDRMEKIFDKIHREEKQPDAE